VRSFRKSGRNENFFCPPLTSEGRGDVNSRRQGQNALPSGRIRVTPFRSITRVTGMWRWTCNRITKWYLDSFNRTKAMTMSKSQMDIAKVALSFLYPLFFYYRLISSFVSQRDESWRERRTTWLALANEICQKWDQSQISFLYSYLIRFSTKFQTFLSFSYIIYMKYIIYIYFFFICKQIIYVLNYSQYNKSRYKIILKYKNQFKKNWYILNVKLNGENRNQKREREEGERKGRRRKAWW